MPILIAFMKDPRFRKCPAVSLRTEAITCGLMLAQLIHEFNPNGFRPFGDYERMHDLCA
jgi:hypothetical protein